MAWWAEDVTSWGVAAHLRDLPAFVIAAKKADSGRISHL